MDPLLKLYVMDHICRITTLTFFERHNIIKKIYIIKYYQ